MQSWEEFLAGLCARFARTALVGGNASTTLDAACRRAGLAMDAAAYYDCILLDDPRDSFPDPRAALESAKQRLAPDGILLVRVAPRPDENIECETAAHEAAQLLQTAGLGLYGEWHLEGRAQRGGEDTAHACAGWALAAVRPDYNPVAHAQKLFGAGNAAACYEVLKLIPEPYLADPETAARIYADMQYCQAVMAQSAGAEAMLEQFFNAQVLFYRVISRVPHYREAYHTQAEMWRRIGGGAMGLRLLQSIQQAAPNPATQRIIDSWPATDSSDLSDPSDPSDWKAPRNRPRVLMVLTAGCPHFGMDVLYDGLCSVLGDENVIEFPWKKTLHRHAPDVPGNYPCLFNRTGRNVPLDEIVALLDRGHFDLVLYCDLDWTLDRESARRIVRAAQRVPVFIADMQDDPMDYRKEAADFLDTPSFRGYFKREMLRCHRYEPHTYPLPFAYPDRLVPDALPHERPQSVFWAGHRRFGLRRLYLERIESLLGERFDKPYSPEDYAAALDASRIGINIFGFGFDTVRYWELPAHGCLLLSERLPIRIPHDFRDSETALFFDNLADLEDKLRYCLAHPEQTAAIAAAGHRHLRQHHTGSARARQLLGWVESLLHP